MTTQTLVPLTIPIIVTPIEETIDLSGISVKEECQVPGCTHEHPIAGVCDNCDIIICTAHKQDWVGVCHSPWSLCPECYPKQVERRGESL